MTTGTMMGLTLGAKSAVPSALATNRFTAPKLHGSGICACCGNDTRFAGSNKPASARRANTSNGIGCGLVVLVGIAVGLYFAFIGNKGKKSSGTGGSDDGAYVPVDGHSHGHDHGGDYGGGGDFGGDCG